MVGTADTLSWCVAVCVAVSLCGCACVAVAVAVAVWLCVWLCVWLWLWLWLWLCGCGCVAVAVCVCGHCFRPPGEPPAGLQWTSVLPRSKLGPNQQHTFSAAGAAKKPFTHLRLCMFPDGGISRFRVYGSLAPPSKL